MNEARPRLEWIQALRGLAALSVVLTHCRRIFLGTSMWGTANYVFLPFAAGVDLFFVISGFIMVYTTFGLSGRNAATAFAQKRFFRIWPAYFTLSLIGMVIAGGLAFWMDGAMLDQFLLSIVFLPVKGDALFSHQALSVGWTINYEVYFYLIFGLSLLAGRFRWAVMAIWFLVTLVAIPAAFGAPSLWNPVENYGAPLYPLEYMRLATSPIIWEFIGGMAAGLLFFSSAKLSNRNFAYGLAAAALCFATWNTWNLHNYISLVVGAGFTVLVGTLAVVSKTVALPVPRLLSWLGDISYTLYLEHLLIIELVRVWVLPPPHSAIIGAIEFAAVAIACVALAGLTSPVLERHLPAAIARWVGALPIRPKRMTKAQPG